MLFLGTPTYRCSTWQSQLGEPSGHPRLGKEASRWFQPPTSSHSSLFKSTPDVMNHRQAIPAVPSPDSWCTVPVWIIKCLLVHTTTLEWFVTQQQWLEPPRSAFLWNFNPVDNFFLFTWPSWWSTYALKLENFHPSYFHPIECRCWWYACEMSNLLKHKSSPLILISCCSEFPSSIVCSGKKVPPFIHFKHASFSSHLVLLLFSK